MLLFMKHTFIQVLIKKTKLEARMRKKLFESRGSDLYFYVLHVQIFIQLTMLGAMTFLMKISKNAGGERVNSESQKIRILLKTNTKKGFLEILAN